MIGEIRTYNGQKWVKHVDGWIHVSDKKAILEKPGGKRETASDHHVEHFNHHLNNNTPGEEPAAVDDKKIIPNTEKKADSILNTKTVCTSRFSKIIHGEDPSSFSLTGGKNSNKILHIHPGNSVLVEKQSGSLGDIYTVKNLTSGDSVKFWEYDYSIPESIKRLELKEDTSKELLGNLQKEDKKDTGRGTNRDRIDREYQKISDFIEKEGVDKIESVNYLFSNKQIGKYKISKFDNSDKSLILDAISPKTDKFENMTVQHNTRILSKVRQSSKFVLDSHIEGIVGIVTKGGRVIGED